MNLSTTLAEYLAAINQELRDVADRFLPGPPDFDQMQRYHLGWIDETGAPIEAKSGKRVRPTILLLSTQIAGGDWRQALPAAAAVELLHNFSLIHDDIEDDSPLRRGRPTLWKIWGVPNAINAGDAMFALAHLALWQLPERGVPALRVLEAARLFEQMCLELTRGQHLDMQFERREHISTDEYLDMIAGKSAALIAASARIGAVVGGAAEDEAARFADFGFNLGMAFQIRDDILGIWGDPAVTGKSAATDIESRKKTLPVLYSLSRSSALVDIFVGEHRGSEELAAAVALLDAVGAREFSVQHERCYYEAAVDALESVGQGEAVSILLELAMNLFGRGA
ncbi:MAG: polyprenyl synthetase family protein [Anaerolineae bacterium]|nr:polyprenyl synthetase family protein [Anaerolineae bacterium]